MSFFWSLTSLTYHIADVPVIVNPLGDLVYICVTSIRSVFSGNLAVILVHQIFGSYVQRLKAVQGQAILGLATYPWFLSSFFLEKLNLHVSNPLKIISSKCSFVKSYPKLLWESCLIFFPQMKMSYLLSFKWFAKLETPEKGILKLGSLFSVIPEANSRCFASLSLNMFLERSLEFIHVRLSSFLSTKPQFSHLESFLHQKEATQVKRHDSFTEKQFGTHICSFQFKIILRTSWSKVVSKNHFLPFLPQEFWISLCFPWCQLSESILF